MRIIPKGTRPMSWRSGSEGNGLCDKFRFVALGILHTITPSRTRLPPSRTRLPPSRTRFQSRLGWDFRCKRSKIDWMSMNEETARAGIHVREAEKAHNIRTFSHGRGAKKKDPNCIQIRVLLWCRKRGSIRAAARSGCGSQAPPEPDSLPHPSTPAIIIIKNKDRLKAVLVFGAGSGGRTRTVSPPRDFESCFVKRSWFVSPPLRRTWSS